jgi:hypothetical protein
MNPLLVLAAAAAFSSNSDPQAICRSARTAALPEDRAGAYQSCVHDETTARDQLKQKWSQFSASARATCAEPPGVKTSYVEMLTCLEMQSGSSFATGKPLAPDTGAPAAHQPAAPKP